MDSENIKLQTTEKKNFQHLPEYILKNRTSWYFWLFFPILGVIYLLPTVFLSLIYNAGAALTLNLFINIVFFFIFPIIFAFLHRNLKKIFIITSKINNTEVINKSKLLILKIKIGSIKIVSKEFTIENIKRFEIIEKETSNGFTCYSALIFNSKKYLIISGKKDEPFAYHYSTELNNFLLKNTSLDEGVLKSELIPYTPSEEKKRFKRNRIIKIILFINIAILCIFVWSNIIFQILGIFSTIFLFGSLSVSILLMLSMNGAYLKGL
ncbi:MAG: hypothetical protein ACTSWY_05835 [Promethearchaeota archaeon]